MKKNSAGSLAGYAEGEACPEQSEDCAGMTEFLWNTFSVSFHLTSHPLVFSPGTTSLLRERCRNSKDFYRQPMLYRGSRFNML
jgi:hypothetical protein